MGELLSYSITGGILMLSMYLAYRLFLSRDNQHSFNRGVLLIIYLVSFVAIPVFLSLEIFKADSGSQQIIDGVEIVGSPVTTLTKPMWGTVLIWIFLVGMVTVAVKTVATWFRLTDVIHSGEKIRHDGYTLVVTDNEKFAPFSWMSYVVISRKDYDNNYSAIATHELKHVDSRHWIDLLIAQVVCILNWFNPAAWFMRDELMLVHEYQADMAVIDCGHDPQEYQLLLIKKAVGSRFPSLANSLNHSKLKKRITMMYKEKSGARRKLKVLALVPMIALALAVAAVPAVRAAVSTISSSDVSVSKSSENLQQDKMLANCFKVTNINDDGKETTIVIKGEGFGNNLTVSDSKLSTDGKTVNNKSLKCEMKNGSASISTTFPVTGKIKNPTLTLTINNEEVQFNLDDFLRSSQTIVVKELDPMSPATSTISIKGNSSSLPGLTYILDGKEISESELKNLSPDKIATIVINKQNNTLIITTSKK